jgi:hypothetical protein
MFPFLDRRKQRLEKLVLLVAAASDQALADALRRLGPEEMAFLLKTLPMDRSNRILAGFGNDEIKAALTASKGDATPSDRMIARFTDELGEERVNGPVTDQGTGEVPIATTDAELRTPISIRALDLAGKVLGKFTTEGDS